MLRITTRHDRSTVVLQLEGRLRGPWVEELRECWRRTREAAGRARIRLELVDVPVVDAAGEALLGQMHRAGVELLGHGCLTKAICDRIVSGARR